MKWYENNAAGNMHMSVVKAAVKIVIWAVFVHCYVIPKEFTFDTKQTPWPLVRERTIPTDRPPLVDEI
jgi:hypothetical protein